MDHRKNSLEFQKLTQNKQPNPLLLKALALFGDFNGFAVELGCGSGIDTILLANNDWKVLSIDSNSEGFNNIEKKVDMKIIQNIEIKNDYFENIEIPEADLIYSYMSLPFCCKNNFFVIWEKITKAIKTNGRIVVSLLGINDDWGQEPDMTFLTKEQVYDLLNDFSIEYFEEINFIGKSVLCNTKKWHKFEIIAKKMPYKIS
ncbi:MAG: class I SAM-dependent methyltransferase [Candidatus Cloacimonetes bacterium]|nr:class I SAM-dependent methyltransferase [Candidatus Cloacimonadota bacterium]